MTNEALFDYDYTTHQDPLIYFDWSFEDKVKNGWRLVTVASRKSEIVAYWEKPIND